MHKKLIALLLACILTPVHGQEKIHFILTGGPALKKWENLRVEGARHDKWWANFIRASTLRMVEIRQAYGKEAKIVWSVYKDGYAMRANEEGKPLTTWIESLAKKRKVQLVWYNTGKKAISSLNSQPKGSIVTFDYFGHSNRYCFLLDYSSKISAASKCWIHQQDISKIRKSIFVKHPISQSWGCYTGHSMSSIWKAYLSHSLKGALGKTDYAVVGQGKMPTINGRWTH